MWYTSKNKAWKLVEVHRDDCEVIEVWARFLVADVQSPGWLLLETLPEDVNGEVKEIWARSLNFSHSSRPSTTAQKESRTPKRSRTLQRDDRYVLIQATSAVCTCFFFLDAQAMTDIY